MNKSLLVFIILMIAGAAPAFSSDAVVTAALDAYARAHDLDAVNILEAVPPQQETLSSTLPSSRKRHEFEVGLERYSYKYREVVDGAEFMNTKGFYNGLLFSYTFRPLDVDCLSNMFRFEGRYASGRVDYTGSGTWSGLKDYMYEVRGLMGYEYDISPSLVITPYLGLGFRYLNNGAEAMPARVIDGQPYYSGYNRESKYYYVPVGVEVYRRLARGWGVGGSLEYDFWRAGRQASHFEDMVDMSGVSAGYDPMYNRQKRGFGWRGSLKIERVLPNVKWSLEPYYRYWKVEDSEIAFMTKGGEMVPVPGQPGYYEAGLEPQNTTQEIGLKMGLMF